jgi:hypothetical protein
MKYLDNVLLILIYLRLFKYDQDKCPHISNNITNMMEILCFYQKISAN